jgi:uncharacterized membrane protein YhaH (DUF805 family)
MASLSQERATKGSLVWLLTSLDGRVGRSVYWPWAVIAFAIGLAATPLDGILIGFVIQITMLYIGVHIIGKRFHDRGKSAWWVLIGIIPIIGWIWILVDCGILAGDPGPNQYGTATTPVSLRGITSPNPATATLAHGQLNDSADDELP